MKHTKVIYRVKFTALNGFIFNKKYNKKELCVQPKTLEVEKTKLIKSPKKESST